MFLCIYSMWFRIECTRVKFNNFRFKLFCAIAETKHLIWHMHTCVIKHSPRCVIQNCFIFAVQWSCNELCSVRNNIYKLMLLMAFIYYNSQIFIYVFTKKKYFFINRFFIFTIVTFGLLQKYFLLTELITCFLDIV